MAFEKTFAPSKIGLGVDVAILAESHSRSLNLHLAELAPFLVTLPTRPRKLLFLCDRPVQAPWSVASSRLSKHSKPV